MRNTNFFNSTLAIILFSFNFILCSDYNSFKSNHIFKTSNPKSIFKSHDFILDLDQNLVDKSFSIVGTSIDHQYLDPIFSFKFNFKKKIYAYMYKTRLNHDFGKLYNGRIPWTKTMNRKRNIFGFGYKNDWVLLQIGKGNENWGAGSNISLALNQYSNSYDYFLLASNYGNVRVRYIHGFLERTEENHNRYINARGIEWTNKINFNIGLSETIIYSGFNRSIDFGYFNPISTHLEIELNDRLNFPASLNATNAVWQFHFDYTIQNLKLSLNYLLDEIVLDPRTELDKEHGKGYAIEIDKSYKLFSNKTFNIFGYFISIGTPTFRHGFGTTNFVQKGKPLGWPNGSDGTDLFLGLKYTDESSILKLGIGQIFIGEESINKRIFDKWKDYLKGTFPSGEVSKSLYIDSYFKYKLTPNIIIDLGICIEKNRKGSAYKVIDKMLGLNLLLIKKHITK